MGTFLSKGTTYVDGVTQVNATNLNTLVDDAAINPTAISSLSTKDPVTGAEELMINDAGTLKKITAQILHAFVAAIPVGTVTDFAGNTAPTGWFFCYGQAISRTTYSALFTALGTAYGVGDGTTTFTLPDLRGRVTAGKDDMGGTSTNRLVNILNGDNLGATGGTEEHTLSIAEMPSHSHTYICATCVSGSGVAFGAVYANNSIVNGGSTGGNLAHSNTQPTIILNKIIKY